jgi:hypothetical protein
VWGREAWANARGTVTPVEQRGALWFKREDLFAPWGGHGPNGAKLRQIILLGEAAVEQKRDGLLFGASLRSPQIPQVAAVARSLGLKCVVVIGGTNATSALKHGGVKWAAWAGARFDLESRLAYNPVLQRRTSALHETYCVSWLRVRYGVERDDFARDAQAALRFHEKTADQVRNIPPHITDLILPVGSFNTCVGVLHGLVRTPPPSLRRVHLIKIGPGDGTVVRERLRAWRTEIPLGDETETALRLLEDTPRAAPFRVLSDDLYGRGEVTYGVEEPCTYEGLVFHPTYEGKIMRYLLRARSELLAPTTLFWVTGGPPAARDDDRWMLNTCGPPPTRVEPIQWVT